MNPRIIKLIPTLSVAFVVLACLTAGCCHGPRKWNLDITKPTTASIRVDLLGVTPSEKVQWQNDVKPDDYWKPNSPIRNGALDRMLSNDFLAGKTWDVSRTNAMWDKWFSYHATELMVMADLPGGPYDNSAFDRRRIFIPLDCKAWKAKDNTLQIVIEDNFIRVLTQQRLKK
jgi:hypothetical protein